MRPVRARTHWTFPQCLAWIVTRDAGRVYDGDLLQQAAPYLSAWNTGNDEQKQDAHSRARSGLLKAFADGDLPCIARNQRSGETSLIPAIERAHLELNVSENCAYELRDGQRSPSPRWSDLLFPVDRVIELWPVNDTPSKPTRRFAPAILQDVLKRISRERGDQPQSFDATVKQVQAEIPAATTRAIEACIGELRLTNLRHSQRGRPKTQR